MKYIISLINHAYMTLKMDNNINNILNKIY